MYCHVFGGCGCRQGMDWITGFIDTLGTTRNYSATADVHNLQFTIGPTKSFPACCVFTSGSPATASNNGSSSASCSQVLPLQTLFRTACQLFPQLNWIVFSSQPHLQSLAAHGTQLTQLSTHLASVLIIEPWDRPNRKHGFQQFLFCCLHIHYHGNVFIKLLPSSGCLLGLHYSGLQPSCHSIVRHKTLPHF
jgi:hypothetical protein